MKIEVPLIKQPKDTVECGFACLNMLLEYYGEKSSIGELKKEIKITKEGTFVPQIGSWLLEHGFDVEIVTLHPSLFTKKDIGISLREVKKRFEALTFKSEKDKETSKYFIDFLDKGGKINVKIPNKTDIEEEINGKRPLFALLTSNFLLGSKPTFNFHFCVVTGIDDEFIYVNDPLWDKRGGKNKYLIEDFFYGLYASAYGCIDNACLVKVRKK